MSELLQIQLSSVAADPRFGKNPLLTPTADGYQIHQSGNEQLRQIQKAGRSLDGLGVQTAQLAGEGWTLDKQWAFYQGFCSAKKLGGVHWTGDEATVGQGVAPDLDHAAIAAHQRADTGQHGAGRAPEHGATSGRRRREGPRISGGGP